MLETYRVYLARKKLIHAMPRNAARQINRAMVVKCAISATFCYTQLFEITDTRKMKSPFLGNIHAETRKLWKRSAIRVATSRPIPTDALGVSASRPQTRSALISKSHRARCQPVPNFPRLRALALFGRRPPERVVGIVGTGVRKPAQKRPPALQKRSQEVGPPARCNRSHAS